MATSATWPATEYGLQAPCVRFAVRIAPRPRNTRFWLNATPLPEQDLHLPVRQVGFELSSPSTSLLLLQAWPGALPAGPPTVTLPTFTLRTRCTWSDLTAARAGITGRYSTANGFRLCRKRSPHHEWCSTGRDFLGRRALASRPVPSHEHGSEPDQLRMSVPSVLARRWPTRQRWPVRTIHCDTRTRRNSARVATAMHSGHHVGHVELRTDSAFCTDLQPSPNCGPAAVHSSQSCASVATSGLATHGTGSHWQLHSGWLGAVLASERLQGATVCSHTFRRVG
jgi:hypothetical protein